LPPGNTEFLSGSGRGCEFFPSFRHHTRPHEAAESRKALSSRKLYLERLEDAPRAALTPHPARFTLPRLRHSRAVALNVTRSTRCMFGAILGPSKRIIDRSNKLGFWRRAPLGSDMLPDPRNTILHFLSAAALSNSLSREIDNTVQVRNAALLPLIHPMQTNARRNNLRASHESN